MRRIKTELTEFNNITYFYIHYFHPTHESMQLNNEIEPLDWLEIWIL